MTLLTVNPVSTDLRVSERNLLLSLLGKQRQRVNILLSSPSFLSFKWKKHCYRENKFVRRGFILCQKSPIQLLCPWVLYEKIVTSLSVELFRDTAAPATLEVVIVDTQNVENIKIEMMCHKNSKFNFSRSNTGAKGSILTCMSQCGCNCDFHCVTGIVFSPLHTFLYKRKGVCHAGQEHRALASVL